VLTERAPLVLLERLLRQQELTQQYADLGGDLERLDRRRSVYDQELEKILAGSTARIAQLQSPRTMILLEIMQLVEGIGG
jgi:hypothetical protein